MRGILRSFLVLALLAVVMPVKVACASNATALVAVAVQQSVFDESYILTAIRNTTRGRYSASTFLSRDSASRLVTEVSRYQAEGKDVDVFFVVRPEMLDAYSETLLPIQPVRFVYSTGGERALETWRRVGARTILSPDSAPPFFLSRFLKFWGEGSSVSHSAARALSFSATLSEAVAKFAAQESIRAASGFLSNAPVFEGQDIKITGIVETSPWTLSAIGLPVMSAKEPVYAHAALEESMMKSFSELVSRDIVLKPSKIPNLKTLVDAFKYPMWSTVQGVFPGRDENHILLPGADVRIILGKIIPDIDQHFQTLIDNLDFIDIKQGQDRVVIDAQLANNSLTYQFAEEKTRKMGQAYAVRLDKRTHIEVYMRKDSVVIDKIRGFSVLMKLPIIPDGVLPRRLKLETSQERLTIWAKAVGNAIDLVATADVRGRKFDGVDWQQTILRNLCNLFGGSSLKRF